MRYLLPLLFLCMAPLNPARANAVPPMATVGAAQAERTADATLDWQYTLHDVIETHTGVDGQAVESLSLPVVDSFLKTIGARADEYPPVFDNAAERADATDKLAHLIIVLSSLDQGATVNVEILRREAFAYNLGCNMDMAGSCGKALELYPRLLKMTPDDPAANYLYGVFRAGLAPNQSEATPYLEKALKLGVTKANFSLGMVYLTLNDKRKALQYLQTYARDFPDDQKAKLLIDAIQNGQINNQNAPGLTPPR